MNGPTWHVKADAAPCAHNGDVGIVNRKGVLMAVAYARALPEITLNHAQLLAAAPDLIDGIVHEAKMRAIDAGQSVMQWRAHIGPLLGPAVDAAMGVRPAGHLTAGTPA